jgi:hypothetical protein
MCRFRFAPILCAALVSIAASGCGQKFYRAETTLAADGRVSRAIYQPADDTPLDARQAGVWSNMTYAAEIRPEKWSGGIRDLRIAAADKDRPYFAAWGEFASPAKMPAHYLMPAPRGVPNGKLAVEYEREDFIFVVEHRWQETLTDNVTLEGLHASRRQFVDVAIPLVQKCLETGLGPEYEVEGVVAWLRDSGRPLFDEVTDAFFEAGARGQLPPSDKWKETMADVCARHGVQLRDADGHLLDYDRGREVVAQFVERVLRDNLRKRGGGQVPRQVIDDLLEWLNLKDHPKSANPRLARLDGLAREVISEQFGSQQKFEELIAPLGARMFGLYRSEILGPPRRFYYTLQTPGVIVETNGVLLADNRTAWKFEAVEAYPFGYPMKCRALVAQVELQRQLLGGQPLAGRASMSELVTLLRGDYALRETLRTCVRQESMEPLTRLRDQLAKDGGDTTSFDECLKLLKPAAASPAK